jgi:hypothetical protein
MGHGSNQAHALGLPPDKYEPWFAIAAGQFLHM